jgi:hypothetical protein
MSNQCRGVQARDWQDWRRQTGVIVELQGGRAAFRGTARVDNNLMQTFATILGLILCALFNFELRSK